MNRGNVCGVIIKRGEPFFFLFLRPVVLRGSDVIIGFGGTLLERSRRVHRCEGRSAQILRGLFHFGSNVRGDADQMVAQDILANLV